jgi:UDP-N-acetylmuramate--alanine ligase
VAEAGTLDLARPRRLHVTNVGGAGMSAVAVLLAEMGHQVSGHDPAASTPFLDRLTAVGVAVTTGEERAPLGGDVEAVICSTATPAEDPDVVAARDAGIDVLHRSAALAALCATRRSVAVAGTHGKTTTSAHARHRARRCRHGLDPGLGGRLGRARPGPGRGLGGGRRTSRRRGRRERRHLRGPGPGHRPWSRTSSPTTSSTTAGTRRSRPAFERFVRCDDGPAVVCADDAGSARRARPPARVGGLSPTAPRPRRRLPHGRGRARRHSAVRFVLHHAGRRRWRSRCPSPGPRPAQRPQRRRRAGGGPELGVELRGGGPRAGRFAGVARRFERRGEAGGVTFVDDYAHLPTEVAAASAARAGGWRPGRVRVPAPPLQPHRGALARLRRRLRGRRRAGRDRRLRAGEAPRPGVTGKLLVDAVLDAHPCTPVATCPGGTTS